MMQVQFNDSDTTMYRINSLKKIGDNIIVLRGTDQEGNNIPENLSGFKLINNMGNIEDCSSFTTRYDNPEFGQIRGIAYSNDGSTEKEENRRLPRERQLSEEAMSAALNSIKEDHIEKSKILLTQYLAEHPLKSSAHGGKEGTYTVTQEKQTLMMSQYMTYQIEKALNPEAKLTWNESGEECEEWTEAEFLQLILEVKQYVYPLVSYQQSMEKAIRACTTAEELDAIVIDYSQFAEGGGEG